MSLTSVTRFAKEDDGMRKFNAPHGTDLTTAAVLWGAIGAYAVGRVCQLWPDRMPVILIVVLHVVPPAVFALVHGSMAYGRRGVAVFAASCLGLGSLAELGSLRTGFPFGHYHFTDVMGPKVLGLPVMLALAYLGIGYASWGVALLILRRAGRPLRGADLLAVPLLGGAVMTAWDLAMDPDWSTVYHVWIWHDGGRFFGVPASNFAGWFLTATLYYFVFAVYCRRQPAGLAAGRYFWSLPALVYLICALGNLLVLPAPLAPSVVTDAVGRQWRIGQVLVELAIVSLLVMAPLACLGMWRSRTVGRAHDLARGVVHAGTVSL